MDEWIVRKDKGERRQEVAPIGKGRTYQRYRGDKHDRRRNHCCRRSLVRTLLYHGFVAAPSDIPNTYGRNVFNSWGMKQ